MKRGTVMRDSSLAAQIFATPLYKGRGEWLKIQRPAFGAVEELHHVLGSE